MPFHIGLNCEDHNSGDSKNSECRYCGNAIDAKVNSRALTGQSGGTTQTGLEMAQKEQSRILEDMAVCSFDGISQFIDVPSLNSMSHQESLEHYGMTALTVEVRTPGEKLRLCLRIYVYRNGPRLSQKMQGSHVCVCVSIL